MLRTRFLALLAFASPLFLLWPPSHATFQGLVCSDGGQAIAGASVRLQGDSVCTRSDAKGQFKLPWGSGRTTASKPGYQIGWSLPIDKPLKITLAPLPSEDNDD